MPATTPNNQRIPLDPNGYSVNPSTGTIHTRYADHARDLPRTRTTKGVLTILDGKEGKACVKCYGKAPRYPDAPRPPQRRRTPTKDMALNGTGPDATPLP